MEAIVVLILIGLFIWKTADIVWKLENPQPEVNLFLVKPKMTNIKESSPAIPPDPDPLPSRDEMAFMWLEDEFIDSMKGGD